MSTIKVSNLQNASAASPAITLAADGSATASLSSVNGGPIAGTRNRIINGDMRIDQRNAGASVTPSTLYNTYTLDRWNTVYSVGSKFSVQQNAGSVTPPSGFNNYLGVTSLSAYTPGSAEQYTLIQSIEGYNVADFGLGAAGASTFVLSFWVRSSLTGTFGGVFSNSAQNRGYPFTYSISAANTWEKKTVTVAGDTSGTWLSTNGTGLNVLFSLGAGSSYLGTAGSWTGTVTGATGQTNIVATSGATFLITGVQLEPGTVATPFERRSYGAELALCQRYYEQNTISGFNGSRLIIAFSTQYAQGFYFITPKRAAPTVTIYNRAGTVNKLSNPLTGGSVGTTVTAANIESLGVSLVADSTTGLASGFGYEANYTASSEL